MRKSLSVLAIVGVCSLARQSAAFVQTDLDRLLKTNECPKCDLSGAVLAGMDLSKAKLEGVNLSGADLSKASLRMADMAGANLSGAMLAGAVFEAADLFQANLSGTNVAEALFEGAYLAEATMDEGQKGLLTKGKSSSTPQASSVMVAEKAGKKVVKEETPAQEATVDTAVPTIGAGSVTSQAAPPLVERPQAKEPEPAAEAIPVDKNSASDSEEAQAQSPREGSAQPTEAPGLTAQNNPPSVESSQPAAPGAEPESLAVANAAGPISPEALLKQVKKSGVCVECDFSGMKLGSVSMKGFYLERANFAGAQLAGANFTEANLKSVNFGGANLQGATFKGSDLYLADFSGANLDGADFRGAVMDGVILGDATLTGAKLDDGKK